ncbi:MAG TPA: Uma2 family endonuclease [Polyangiaceae bacterium]
MALPAVAFPNDAPIPDEDRFIVVHGVEWQSYCTVRELVDGPGVRMTYLKGALEIMSPSKRHEVYKTGIARLIELYALERDIRLMGYGSTTFRKELAERGLEPDECYVVDRELPDDDFPDIALEVVMTSGGINKLEVYRGLGVKEVWFWHKGDFAIYRLSNGAYERSERSALLPELDFVQLAGFAEQSDQHAALKAYRDALRVHS